MSTHWPTFKDALIAYKECRLHKPASGSQIAFEARLGKNLLELVKEIQSGVYRPKPANCFIVTRPRPREIFAADFRDRVVHHLLIKQLEPIWERKFIYSTFACRKGKGPHQAIKYLQRKVRELSQGGRKDVWCLQLDLEKFFVKINRNLLCDLMLKHCADNDIRQLIEIIYQHDARHGVIRSGNSKHFSLVPNDKSWFSQMPDQGIPIGNLTSQFGANVYLSGLDHFIQRQLKPKAYLRYMDDLLLLDSDPSNISNLETTINSWLVVNRKQKLNFTKTKFTKLSSGITYLGYGLKQTDLPKQPLQVFLEPKKKWQFVAEIKHLERTGLLDSVKPHLLAPRIQTKEAKSKIASINSRLGSMKIARSFLFRKQTIKRFILNTTINGKLPKEFADHWCPFSVKEGYRAIRLR